MAFYLESFYEGESTNIKIDHSDFVVESQENFDKDIKELIAFLISIESKYKTRLEGKDGKYDSKLCNEVYVETINHFNKGEYSLIVIYDEITEFFKLDYKKFFGFLDTRLKKKLIIELKTKINLEKNINNKRKEEINAGGVYQPSFK